MILDICGNCSHYSKDDDYYYNRQCERFKPTLINKSCHNYKNQDKGKEEIDSLINNLIKSQEK